MKLKIFESTLCCPTGVCEPEPDKKLIELQNVLQVLSKAGIKVERYAINQSPLAFTKNQVVKQFIQSEGPGKLPVTLLDGEIIKMGGYPELKELEAHIPGINNIKTEGKILGIFS